MKDQMKLLIRALIERTDECDTLKHKNEELQSNLLEVSDLLAKQSEKYEILKDQNEALKHETKTLESNLEQVRGSLFIAVQQYESLRYEFESLRMPTVYKCTICNYYPANYRNNPCNHLCFCTNCKNAYPNDTKMCRAVSATVRSEQGSLRTAEYVTELLCNTFGRKYWKWLFCFTCRI